ncbi:tetratricopeptide repeat protein [Deinococcus multiflagellatus]|uniref:Tetratricopeptide repeat protein n=1 Tax=Deinococcus multiflagellatus TaxID=1656887 RepID=A0ABW1ZEN7_9DEIO|nr:tetratricopeptide repeat protein [Deinococcus multiflagellatus]MBZ9713011.1 tetratricopeptide repeat protein [Deinococcus multiflagellatus]
MSGPSDAPALPPVRDLVAAGDWRRAAITARLAGETAAVQEALGALDGVQDAVRARRYPSARRALGEYRRALDDAEGEPLLAGLRAQVPPDEVLAALNALEGSQKETEPAALKERLLGALTLPLTRAEALNMQGVLYAVRGEADDARRVLDEARVADPGHYRALTNLGNLDMEAGRFAQAEAVYREVLRLNPDYDGGHHNLGVALRRQGKVAEGVRSIRRGQRLAMKRSKDDTDAEMKERFAASPALRNLRWGLLAGLGLIVYLALRGG